MRATAAPKGPKKSSGKRSLFQSEVDVIRNLLQRGIGIALSDIRDMINYKHGVVKIAAQSIRKCLLEADFDLEDKYYDAQELNHSWKDMVLLAGLGAFFSVLYNVNQTKLLAETITNCDDSTEKESEVNDSVAEDRKITKLKALYQTMYYNVHNGRCRTPLYLTIFMTNARAGN